MSDASDAIRPQRREPRSVQHYIDELPMWADGTNLSSVPMTLMQWRIWALAACGKFFVGFIIFVTGVALPLISREFGIPPREYGLISAASLLGILIGAAGLGGLSDYFGRKTMFIAEMFIFVAFLVALVVSNNFALLIFCLFGLGLALGCDYPTAHLIISENICTANRGRLVLAAYTFQAVGALIGTAIGFAVLTIVPQLDAWRWMYGLAILPAVAVTIGRFSITESANWLHIRGAHDRAEAEVGRLLSRAPPYPRAIALRRESAAATERTGYAALFRRDTRRATLLACVPWFLQDIGSYGIGIFTPTILGLAFGGQVDHIRSVNDLILTDIFAAEGAALISVLLILGIVVAMFLTDRIGRIRLQVTGFLGCSVGMLIAAISGDFSIDQQIPMLFAGFMLFNFMTNLGPSSHTYLIAGEVFPTEIRATGAGFAAAVGKVGAVAAAYFFPILILLLGPGPLLYVLAGTSLLGALVTLAVRIETAGVRLDKIGQAAEELIPMPGPVALNKRSAGASSE